MTRTVPATGTVFGYPYLWKWQAEDRATEGRKDRPDQMALPVPPLECRRADLREWKGGWIAVWEYNYDVAERSFYLDPNAVVSGQFSPAFLGKIAATARP